MSNLNGSGSILGLSRKEIGAAFDAIIDFAGIQDFLDTPIRNSSSGMYVRLGFAIAVHVDPDILLVDEILSVGDVTFQERSLAHVDPNGDGRARIGKLRFDVPGHDLAGPVPSGAKAKLEVIAVDDLVGRGSLAVGIALRRPDLPSAVYETRYVAPPPAGVSLRVTVNFELNALTGTYLVDVLLGNAETDEVHERRLSALQIVCTVRTMRWALPRCPHR